MVKLRCLNVQLDNHDSDIQIYHFHTHLCSDLGVQFMFACDLQSSPEHLAAVGHRAEKTTELGVVNQDTARPSNCTRSLQNPGLGRTETLLQNGNEIKYEICNAQ